MTHVLGDARDLLYWRDGSARWSAGRNANRRNSTTGATVGDALGVALAIR